MRRQEQSCLALAQPAAAVAGRLTLAVGARQMHRLQNIAPQAPLLGCGHVRPARRYAEPHHFTRQNTTHGHSDLNCSTTVQGFLSQAPWAASAVTAPYRCTRKGHNMKFLTCLAVTELRKARAVCRVHVDMSSAVQQRDGGPVLAGQSERGGGIYLRLGSLLRVGSIGSSQF